MSTDNGYRVVTTERDENRVERFSRVYPPLNEPAIDRDAAVERIDMELAWLATFPTGVPGTLSHEMLPHGRARMKVVTDEQARELTAAAELTGAVR